VRRHNALAKTSPPVAQPVKIDNDLYVRDYSRCILCYKCRRGVWRRCSDTFAIGVAGRGFDAHISTEFTTPLPVGLRLLRATASAVSHGRPDVQERIRHAPAGSWDESQQTVTETCVRTAGSDACSSCTSGQLDRQVTSPLDHSRHRRPPVREGTLRFEFVSGEGR